MTVLGRRLFLHHLVSEMVLCYYAVISNDLLEQVMVLSCNTNDCHFVTHAPTAHGFHHLTFWETVVLVWFPLVAAGTVSSDLVVGCPT